MDIAVVDDEKAIREHICALIEEQQLGAFQYSGVSFERPNIRFSLPQLPS